VPPPAAMKLSSTAIHTLPPMPLRRFTVEEYRRFGEVGVLTADDRVELLDGWIVEKMVHNPRHDATVDKAHQSIRALLSSSWRVRVQSAIATDRSEPEPDLAVVRAAADWYATRHPGADDIALLVEVADTSLARDRDVKLSVYARAGIPLYWIVNLLDDRVEVYAGATGLGDSARFATRRDFSRGERVPLTIGGLALGELAVGDLLA